MDDTFRVVPTSLVENDDISRTLLSEGSRAMVSQPERAFKVDSNEFVYSFANGKSNAKLLKHEVNG